jgi:hypothetical protein
MPSLADLIEAIAKDGPCLTQVLMHLSLGNAHLRALRHDLQHLDHGLVYRSGEHGAASMCYQAPITSH